MGILARTPRGILPWWGAALLWLVPFGFLRSIGDNAGLPRHGTGFEEALFGGLPSLWLQELLYPLWPGGLPWVTLIIHASWFIVPWLAALLVSWRRSDRTGSFFRWWLAIYAVILPLWVLFPFRPPWMEDAQVIRMNELVMGDIQDSNPLAAMPSFHVALPLTLALWFLRENWRLPGRLLVAYSCLVALEVVVSGEHYVVDALGAIGLAVVVAGAACFDWPGALLDRRKAGPTPLPRAQG